MPNDLTCEQENKILRDHIAWLITRVTKEDALSPISGTEFHDLRVANGLTKQCVAEYLMVAPMSVWRWENSRGRIPRYAADGLRTLIASHQSETVDPLRIAVEPDDVCPA